MQFIGSEPPLRYFTPEEANALLPEVTAILADVAEVARTLRPMMQERREHPEVPELQARAKQLLEQIRGRGVEVKGIENGLLDFPALRNGKTVYLCWKQGETRIEWWHPLHTGIRGRQRLDDDPTAQWEWRN